MCGFNPSSRNDPPQPEYKTLNHSIQGMIIEFEANNTSYVFINVGKKWDWCIFC